MADSGNIFAFNSMYELMERFPTEQDAKDHFAYIRWRGNPVCPHCEAEGAYKRKSGRSYKCRSCKKEFTVKTGTVFAESKVGMKKWFMAIYLLMVHKKGISSCQLAKDVGVTQKSAWFMLHRIREIFNRGSFEAPAKGVVEIDETYMGGKEKNKHAHKKTKGRGAVSKTPVMGVRTRKGKVFARIVENTKTETMEEFVHENVARGAIVMTDEHAGYRNMSDNYDHRFVRHGRKQYVDGIDNDTHTNGIEGYWGHLKRMVIGIYHAVSDKHLNRYLCTQSSRYNHKDITIWEIFTLTLDESQGKRLTYKQLKMEVT